LYFCIVVRMNLLFHYRNKNTYEKKNTACPAILNSLRSLI
jgi:hypothetical protein